MDKDSLAKHKMDRAKTIELLYDRMSPCRLCPRVCEACRLEGKLGFCKIGKQPIVASYGPHHGEEDCLRGWRGSGTIFFAGCNLGCVFCQNWEISHERIGRALSVEELAHIMLQLQRIGCHNINWVTPTHVTPPLIEALDLARRRGLTVPVVYNCGGYECVETLRLLEGWIEIYMPDFKFWDSETAQLLANAPDYPERARRAIKEMHRQVGDLIIGSDGLAIRGLLVRHLVMPGQLDQTREILRWIAKEISPDTYVNLMPQYRPEGAVLHGQRPDKYGRDLARYITPEEYSQAIKYAWEVGLRRIDTRHL